MKFGPLLAVVLLAGGAGAAAFWIKSSSSPQAAQSGQAGGGANSRRRPTVGAAPVSVAKVTQQSVPVYRDGIGNVQALNNVTVRAQVDGRLLSIDFKEGQDVTQGQKLAQIDPAIYKAQYDQAVAKKAQDEANLANAKIDLERYTKLAKSNAGPQQQADQQAATVAQLEAQVAADQAAIDNAKATLDYTTVVSPLNGRVGLRQVDPGNIVHASDSTGIVSITQLKPIAVLFTLPQRDLQVTQAAITAGQVAVEIPNSDGTKVDAKGTLKSIDNQIDVTTGTIKLKAEFSNDDLKLWPGQFVSVRVIVSTMTDVKVVPATAIRRGVDGDKSYNFVYTVDGDSISHIKRIDVRMQDEKIAVLAGDLDVGQTVVTEGFSQLSDGKPVQISDPGASTRPAGSNLPVTGGSPAAPSDAASPKKDDHRSRNKQDSNAAEDAAKTDRSEKGKREHRPRQEAVADPPNGGDAKGAKP
jgi:membrane fusion protein, multidrug efflux system